MSWSRDKVVLIASGKKEPRTWLGTGFVVAPRRVLTARHVLEKSKDKWWPDLCVRRERSDDSQPENKFLPAKILWPGSESLDVAVLEAEIGGAVDPLALQSARPIAHGIDWEAQGYAEVRHEQPSDKLEKAGGTTRSCATGEQELCLDTTAPPEVWRGLSGAAVVIGSEVVGVIRSVPHGWDGRRLTATPVTWLLKDAEFREALGLGAEYERLAKELADLQDQVARRLQNTPVFAAALAKHLGVGGSTPQAVARAAVNVNGAALAKALNEIDDTLKTKEDRDVVRDLLTQILPLAVDWRHFVTEARAAVTRGSNAIEVSLRTETIAEIVLAGVDGRSCLFAPGGSEEDLPDGVARVRIPPTVYAPLFPTGEGLLEAVVTNLGLQGGEAAKHWLAIKKRFPNPRELKTVVERELKNRSRANPPSRLSHYLLFIDADVDPGGKTDAPALWGMVQTVLGKELPSLRLVRLTGTDLQKLDEEHDIAHYIWSIRDRRR